jgi:hypothetical protein
MRRIGARPPAVTVMVALEFAAAFALLTLGSLFILWSTTAAAALPGGRVDVLAWGGAWVLVLTLLALVLVGIAFATLWRRPRAWGASWAVAAFAAAVGVLAMARMRVGYAAPAPEPGQTVWVGLTLWPVAGFALVALAVAQAWALGRPSTRAYFALTSPRNGRSGASRGRPSRGRPARRG